MITDAIINLLKGIISGLLNMLPSSPSFLQGSISPFVSRLAPLNSVLPIQEVFTFLLFAFTVTSVFLTTWVVNRIINLIRGAG